MSSTQEVWVDIRNYEGYYQISNKGRIKSLEREVSHDGITYTQPERILCHWCGTTSLYDCVRLYKGGVGTKFTVHRLVAEYFLEDWDPRLEVNHLDGNRYNNAADNLKWDYGEKSPNAKLTNAEAEAIRVAYHAGGISQESLALQYGVSRQTVSDIINYKKYIR